MFLNSFINSSVEISLFLMQLSSLFVASRSLLRITKEPLGSSALQKALNEDSGSICESTKALLQGKNSSSGISAHMHFDLQKRRYFSTAVGVSFMLKSSYIISVISHTDSSSKSKMIRLFDFIESHAILRRSTYNPLCTNRLFICAVEKL